MKMDDPSACLYLYTDGLSDELLFFAQACPRWMIRLQYKSGHSMMNRDPRTCNRKALGTLRNETKQTGTLQNGTEAMAF